MNKISRLKKIAEEQPEIVDCLKQPNISNNVISVIEESGEENEYTYEGKVKLKINISEIEELCDCKLFKKWQAFESQLDSIRNDLDFYNVLNVNLKDLITSISQDKLRDECTISLIMLNETNEYIEASYHYKFNML